MSQSPELLVDGLGLSEGPRWRTADMLPASCAKSAGDGKLWFSDMVAKKVRTVDLNGRLEDLIDVPGIPSGLGWLPDGTFLIISAVDGMLMALRDGLLESVVDIKALTGFGCNDMVVDSKGRAHIGSPGGGMNEFQVPGPGNMSVFGYQVMVAIDSDGVAAVRIVADRMTAPNGPCTSADGKTLIVAETWGFRLTAFDIADDGSLQNRRVWADLGVPTDGLTMDMEGCIWVAVPYFEYGGPGGYVRVAEGGELKQCIEVDNYAAYACTLGGAEMKTLFMCESTVLGQERANGHGRIRTVDVDVPGIIANP